MTTISMSESFMHGAIFQDCKVSAVFEERIVRHTMNGTTTIERHAALSGPLFFDF